MMLIIFVKLASNNFKVSLYLQAAESKLLAAISFHLQNYCGAGWHTKCSIKKCHHHHDFICFFTGRTPYGIIVVQVSGPHSSLSVGW